MLSSNRQTVFKLPRQRNSLTALTPGSPKSSQPRTPSPKPEEMYHNVLNKIDQARFNLYKSTNTKDTKLFEVLGKVTFDLENYVPITTPPELHGMESSAALVHSEVDELQSTLASAIGRLKSQSLEHLNSYSEVSWLLR